MATTKIPAEFLSINAISGTLIADNAITTVHIAQNAITSVQIPNNSIGTVQIALNTVTSTHIAENNITTIQLANNSVQTLNIADDQVTAAKLADAAVVTASIVDLNVTTAKIAANAITASKIPDGSITATQIGANAVTLAKMASLTRGSILIGNSAADVTALGIGTSGYVLKSDGTDIAWAAEQTTTTLTTAAQPNITSLGTLTTLTVDDITINGSTISDGADLTLDVEGDIILDANGGDIRFKDAGTAVAVFENDSLDFKIVNSTQDKDIIFRGNDGGSGVDALTLDMSEAGAATFNAGASFGGDISHTASSNFDIKNTIASQNITFHTRASGGSTAEKMRITHDGMVFIENDTGKFKAGGSGDLEMYHDGSNSYIADVGTGELILKGTVAAETSAYIKQVALTSASTVSWDSAAAANAMLVPGANLTIGSPSNSVEGAVISVEIAMNGTPRTIAWHTVFEFAASTAPVATATANKTDIFTFRYNGSVWQEIGRVQNMAQT